jgi:23S rRNA (guanosine2251-2'-O)-methyltransferase
MADKRSGPPSRGGGFGGSRGGPPSRGGPSRDSRGPSRGGFGGGSRDGGERSSRPSFGDRPPPRGDRPFGDRPPRGDRPFGDRPPRREGGSFGGPPRGDRPFNDRPPRRDGDRPFGDRPPRRDGDRPSFNDRPKRDFNERPSYDLGPPRGDRPSYADRPKRDYNDRPPRDDNREERGPRRDTDLPFEDRPRRSFQRDGFGSSRKRDDMNTERPRGEGSYAPREDRPRSDGPRPERREYSSDRGPKRDFGDRPQRSYDSKPPRREGFEKRPERVEGEDGEFHEAPRATMKGHEMVIFGVHAVQAALRNPNRKVTAVWVSDIGEAHLAGAYEDRHPKFETMSKREIESKLPPGAVHQGIAIAVEPLDDVFLSDIMTAANAPNAGNHVVVVLDEVTDPHNVGAVLRSMSMFGAKAMIVHKRNAPSITGTMAKIATGAIEHIPMVAVTNLSQALEELKLNGFYCLGLDEDATISLSDVPTDRPIAIVLGNEGEGLRAKTRTTCDAIAAIPSFGAIKSLNVSNAAAIALYSVTKK